MSLTQIETCFYQQGGLQTLDKFTNGDLLRLWNNTILVIVLVQH